jgi:endonuclease/exonuclease/phosphatase family metal-dependent hydrolase
VSFRVATLNLEQNHKRWLDRRELIADQLAQLRPDVLALNEVCIPLQTGRYLQQAASQRLDVDYNLVQQSKANGVDGEGLITKFLVKEGANFDYQARESVAQVVRLEVEGHLVDVYVTHLYQSRGEDSLRLYQVQRLLDWINSRDDVAARIVCGDFNATLDMPSAKLMAGTFRPTQTQPTAFSPLQEVDGSVSHPNWERFDRCIDYIWVTGPLQVMESGLCFNTPSPNDATLWPSDHIGVWADLEIE